MDAPTVQYVRTSDGYDIAYTIAGKGQPLVMVAPSLNHVQLNWKIPSAGSWHAALSSHFQLIHFDSRGSGLSTRGLSAGLALDDFHHDLDAVLTCLGVKQVIMFGVSSGTHVVVPYALKHPDRVAALVLLNGFVEGNASPLLLMEPLASRSWEGFLEAISPGTNWSVKERQTAVSDFRQMVTQADWLTYQRAVGSSSLANLLPRISTPTLVIQSRNYKRLDGTEGAKLAALVPNARLTLIDGEELYGDANQGVRAIETFLVDLPQPGEPADADVEGLSERELEVLRLLALGKSNPQIAEALFITRNTVQNHVSSILIKLNLQNRAQAAVYANEHGIV